jgi:threonine/homoserine/homoserine lactone efflux protein
MTELLAGLSLGLGAGISPGPLLTLVVTTTLERGFAAGSRVAVAPLLTDAPIIALTVAVVSSVPDTALRGLGITGGVVVAGMGLWTIVMARRPIAETEHVAPSVDLWRGVVVNVLSPHPWIFWIGVGAPLLVSSWRDAPERGIAFLVGFYFLLVGSKLVIAWLVARAGRRLGSVARTRLLVAGGLLLVAGGAVLLWEAATGSL